MDHWTDLFWHMANFTENPELPVLYSWKLTQPLGESTQRLAAERNPYYWKVDPEGNQLPYIDRVVFTITEKEQVAVLKALNGEVDMQHYYINDLQNKPVFYKNQKKGHYHFYNVVPTDCNTMSVSLNLTHRDPMKRKVFQNRDFRIGLSYAMNRQEIIDTLLVSQGEPWQMAPLQGTPGYDERLAKQYTEHNVQKANEYLDKVAPKKDSQGFRLWPNSKRLFFQIDVISDAGRAPWVDMVEMIKRHWKEVGIDIQTKSEAGSLYSTRVLSNQHDAAVWYGSGGLDYIFVPFYYFPSDPSRTQYAIPWAKWYENPKAKGAVEPPEAAKKQMKLYDRLRATPDGDEQNKLMNQILDIAREEFWCMGISRLVPKYGIVKNNFHNVPKSMISTWLVHDPAYTNPQQYFIEMD